MKIAEADLPSALGNTAMIILLPIDQLLMIPITLLFVEK